MTTSDAERFGVADRDIVEAVVIESSDERVTCWIFGECLGYITLLRLLRNGSHKAVFLDTFRMLLGCLRSGSHG